MEILTEDKRTPLLLLTVEANKVEKPKTVFIYGHLDKQPPLTDKWSSGLGPYTPVIKDRKLYGRGAADDGYAIFGYVCVIKALQKFDLPHHKLVLIFESDEESGSNDILHYLKQKEEELGKPDEVICSDANTINYKYLCFITS